MFKEFHTVTHINFDFFKSYNFLISHSPILFTARVIPGLYSPPGMIRTIGKHTSKKRLRRESSKTGGGDASRRDSSESSDMYYSRISTTMPYPMIDEMRRGNTIISDQLSEMNLQVREMVTLIKGICEERNEQP